MQRFLDTLPALLTDAVLDGARMLPFLFLAYLLIEWLERHHGERIEKALAGGGRWGFVPGALLGCVPQCGFSTLAANLYASRVITPGALLAAVPQLWRALALLLAGKIVLGIAAGAVLDLPLRRVLPRGLYGGYAGSADEVDCHEEHEAHSGIIAAALRHTLEIFAFVLVFNFVIGAVFGAVGAETVTALLGGLGVLQPAAAALIGMVPNCAASVLLAQLYLQGAIGFGSLFAGLAAGAGIGLAVLWRVNPSRRQNLFLTGLLWLCGTAIGIVLQFLPV